MHTAGPRASSKPPFRPPLPPTRLLSHLKDGFDASALDGLHLLHHRGSVYRGRDVVREYGGWSMSLCVWGCVGLVIQSEAQRERLMMMTMVGGREGGSSNTYLGGASSMVGWCWPSRQCRRACSRGCGVVLVVGLCALVWCVEGIRTTKDGGPWAKQCVVVLCATVEQSALVLASPSTRRYIKKSSSCMLCVHVCARCCLCGLEVSGQEAQAEI